VIGVDDSRVQDDDDEDDDDGYGSETYEEHRWLAFRSR
jgi:hypothetical protein